MPLPTSPELSDPAALPAQSEQSEQSEPPESSEAEDVQPEVLEHVAPVLAAATAHVAAGGEHVAAAGDGPPCEAAVALARRQLGLASYSQLRDKGLSKQQIRTMVARGEWARELRGVYRLGAAAVTWESRVQAHLLAAGSPAVASHRTAAVLHRFEGFNRRTPEITVPRTRSYNHRNLQVHHSSDLDLVESVPRHGIPTTPPVRTLLDLAAVVDRDKVHQALEDARRRDLISWDGVLASLVAHARRGRPGIARLRSIVDEHRAEVVATENGFERLVAAALLQAGLPRPEVQHTVCLDGEDFRLDLAYPARLVAIELDGSKHREKGTFERDRPRQNALILAGWTVLRYTWAFYRRRCPRLVGEVRAALGTD